MKFRSGLALATCVLFGSLFGASQGKVQKPRRHMQQESPLVKKNCIPCQGGIPALKGAELNQYLEQLGNGWKVVDEHHLEKEYRFNDFRQGLDFVNRVGELAESEGHHPDLYLAWGKVVITLWTHKINGLTESDFILAAKCDQL